jgi:polygalacturonase
MQLILTEFSPCADGVRLDTSAFQSALDRIAAHGAGTLTVPPGRYLVGGLTLPSNLTLVLEAGAVLLLSPDYADYAANESAVTIEQSTRACLFARGQNNITIRGSGTIDGNGAAYCAAGADQNGYRAPQAQRPRVIAFEDCSNVRLLDFTIRQAPVWTVHLISCTRVWLERLTIDNDLTMSNTDAIDIDSCQHVYISNCYISAADDCICLKTTRKPAALQRPTRHVVVSNCTLRSKSCAIKLGTESFDDIEDVLVTNCVVYESNRGIGLVSRDGGNFRRLMFSQITLDCALGEPCHWGKADPIYLSVRVRDPAIVPGVIEHVQFKNLQIRAEGAINMTTERPGALRHISLDGIDFEQRASASPEQGLYDVRPPCNPARPTGAGLDNAYLTDPSTGRAFGVHAYPGGMPAVFIQGGQDVRLDQVGIRRPAPLPAGWHENEVVEL